MSINNLSSIVNAHADAAYRQISRRHSAFDTETIHTLGICGEVCPLVAERLLAFNGIRSRIQRSLDLRIGHRRLRYHDHLRVASDAGPLVVDAAWQQFLSAQQRTNDLPKVLFGTTEQVIATATKAGVHQADAELLWLPSQSI